MKWPPPLRYSIPGLIFGVALLLVAADYGIQLNNKLNRATDEASEMAERQASRLAGLALKAANTNDNTSLLNEFNFLNEDMDMKYAVVCDPKNRIRQSSVSEWQARNINSTGADDASDLVRRTRKARDAMTLTLPSKDLVIAASPVLGVEGENIPSVAIVERDLSSLASAARRKAATDTGATAVLVFAAGGILWLGLSLLLLPRARHTLTEARNLRDATEPTPPLEGDDEFAHISATLQTAHEMLTAQARALRGLQERNQRFVDSLPASVLVCRGDRIESVNPAALKLLGAASPDQLIGRSPFDILHPDFHAPMRDALRVMTTSGINPQPVEQKINTLAGTSVDVESSITGFQDEQGPAYQLVWRDLSERKSAEAGREMLTRDLNEKNKELEAIVYVASHDLRSPLLNVVGFSRQISGACHQLETILGSNGATVKVAELEPLVRDSMPRALKFIEQGVAKMDALLSGFLRYSRAGRVEIDLQTLDMNALLKNIVGDMSYQLQQAGAEVRVSDLPECRGDAMQISQVFTNLLDNALKYREAERGSIIFVEGLVEGNRAIYKVTDNGIGIAPEHQARIFEIFHRLHPAMHPGEGLGLTIAQRIVQRHEGSISVASQPGVGSTFSVTLPAA